LWRAKQLVRKVRFLIAGGASIE